MKIEEKIIQIDGININYATVGEGASLLFLSNGGGFWQIWEHQINFFAKNYKIYAIDWPGCGKSELPEESLTLDYLFATLTRFIDLLKLKNVSIISTCVGSAVGTKYAINNPNNINKLVIINMCPGDRVFPNDISRTLIKKIKPNRIRKKILALILRLLVTKTPLKKKFPRALFGNQCNSSSKLFNMFSEIMKTNKQALTRLELMLNAHTYNINNYFIKDKMIDHILIWGDNNLVAPLDKQGYYHYKLLKPREFYIIKDSGHLCMYEKPTEVDQIIQQYFNNNQLTPC